MPRTTRRQALVTIAASFAAGPLSAQQAYEPKTFSTEDYDLLGTLVDMIIPESDTPGARQAGVHAMLDEDLGRNNKGLAVLRDGMATLREAGFAGMSSAQRIEVLTRYSGSTGPEGDFFETLKGLTIDAYYSTEIGLVQELGYQGNTYLTEFPGCTHEHLLDDAD